MLARLPDVTADLPAQRSAKQSSAGKVGYRFDPPQKADHGSRTAVPEQPSEIRNPKLELPNTPQNSRPPQPHVFERGRIAERQPRLPRRESPILPQSNPFAIPRRRLVDSVTPVLRFLTLVALFTAAGTWVQVVGRHSRPESESIEPPKTASQGPTNSSTTKTVDRPAESPTAAGPVGTTPESGTRVGRVRENDDFAAVQKETDVAKRSVDAPVFATLDLVGANGGPLPHVQTTEPAVTGVGDDPARFGDPARDAEAARAPEIARLPGFIIEIPSR